MSGDEAVEGGRVIGTFLGVKKARGAEVANTHRGLNAMCCYYLVLCYFRTGQMRGRWVYGFHSPGNNVIFRAHWAGDEAGRLSPPSNA